MNPNTLSDRTLEMLIHDDAPCGDIRQREKALVATVNRKKRQISNSARIRIGAAGGIHSANAQAYTRAGADILVTFAPFFAPPRDVVVTLNAL